MILFIDNYDSFTYNLVQYVGELGIVLEVVRNDQYTVDQIAALKPEKIIISPGPGTPDEAGISCAVIEKFGPQIPILGVCLGHQCLGQVCGGKIIRAANLMHGKTSLIHHRQQGIFKGMPNPFAATRYHSLIVERATLPKTLKITAETEEGEIMGLCHTSWKAFGVQFHPESILTQDGKKIIRNFVAM